MAVAPRSGPITVAEPGPPRVGVVRQDEVVVAGQRWRRMLLRTTWLSDRHDLGAVLGEAIGAVAHTGANTGWVLAVAEKAAIVTSGRVVPVDQVRAGRLATLLARWVRPVGNSRGLSVPEKMQYVIEHCGRLRVLTAAVAAAAGRPVGLRGVFYRIAGTVARDLDGARGAYASSLLPPLTAGEARLLAHHLEVRLGLPVAIVDVNDRGGSVRGCSSGCPPADDLLTILADNPLGHREQSTPAILLRT